MLRRADHQTKHVSGNLSCRENEKRYDATMTISCTDDLPMYLRQRLDHLLRSDVAAASLLSLLFQDFAHLLFCLPAARAHAASRLLGAAGVEASDGYHGPQRRRECGVG